MSKLTVLLPAYNEEENVEELVENWLGYEEKIKNTYNIELNIVLINDGSQDNTKQISEKLEAKYSNFKLINHEANKGLGEGIKTAIKYVIKNSTYNDYACIMDCDNTQDPKYIMDMLRMGRVNEDEIGADIIIASRFQEGSSVKGLSNFRHLTSAGAKFVYSSVLKIKNVKDYTCGYRLYKVSILKKGYYYFGENIIEETGFTCMAEILYKLYSVGGVCDEIPFVLRYDYKKGASKMNILKTSLDSLHLAFHLRKSHIDI